MPANVDTKLILTSFGFGSLYSYEMTGDYLVGRLFGLIPAVRIHLAAIHYLRLATRSEVPAMFMLFRWIHFLPNRKATRPLYVLQTRSRNRRVFLRLDNGSHYRLRSAIGRYAIQNNRMAA